MSLIIDFSPTTDVVIVFESDLSGLYGLKGDRFFAPLHVFVKRSNFTFRMIIDDFIID